MGEHEKFTLTRMTVDGVDIPLDDDGKVTFEDIDYGMAVDCSSLIFPIGNPVDMEIPLKVTPYYPEWHFFRAVLFGEKLSNNFLKLHGCPMRRRYVGKHTNQKRRGK